MYDIDVSNRDIDAIKHDIDVIDHDIWAITAAVSHPPGEASMS